MFPPLMGVLSTGEGGVLVVSCDGDGGGGKGGGGEGGRGDGGGDGEGAGYIITFYRISSMLRISNY